MSGPGPAGWSLGASPVPHPNSAERKRGPLDDFQRAGLGPWLVRGKSRDHGPFSLRQLRALVQAGKLTERHQLSTDGASWVPARRVPGLWSGETGKPLGAAAVSARGEPDWERDIIVRVSISRLSFKRDGVDDILFVAPEGVCFAQKHRTTALPVLHTCGLHEISLADSRFRRTVRRIRWEEIESAEFSWPCEAGATSNASDRVGRDLCINVRGAPPIRMFVPYGGASRVVDALRHRLGDRLREGCEPFGEPHLARSVRLLDVFIGFLAGPLVLFAIIVWLLLGWAMGYFRAVDSDSGRRARARFLLRIVLPPVIVAVMALPVFLSSILLDAGSRDQFIWVFAGWWALAFLVPAVVVANSRGAILAFPRKRIESAPARTVTPHWFERLCARWPRAWATRPVGFVLKCFAVLIAIATFTVIDSGVVAPLESFSVRFVGLTLALALAFMGYRCSIGSALRLRASDKRPPIVFLRSFREDGHGSFSMNDWRGRLLGITSLDDDWALLGPLSNANPVRIARLLMGRGGDTAEEQLAAYVRNHGPFIAIGRPDEGLPMAGAARDYVDDASWKQRVLEWIREARLVIIQPGLTEGVRWEIEQALDAVSPDKVIFALTSFDGAPEAYESFVLWLRQSRGIDCPLYRGGAAFLSIDTSRAVLEPLRNCTPMAWPIRGCSADFSAMLSNRLGSPGAGNRLGGWDSEGSIANVKVLLAGLGWFLLTVAMVVVIGRASTSAVTAVRSRWYGDALCFGNTSRTLVHAGCTWDGSDFFRESLEPRFAFEIPGVVRLGGTIVTPDADRPAEDQVREKSQAIAALLGWRGREFDAADGLAASGVRWSQQVYRLRAPDGEQLEGVIRSGVTPHGLAIHWAVYPVDSPCNRPDRLQQIVESVRVTGPPEAGADYWLEPGARWAQRDPAAGVAKAYAGPGACELSLLIQPRGGHLDGEALETIATSLLNDVNESVGTRFEEVVPREHSDLEGSAPRRELSVLATASAEPPARLAIRLVSVRGWVYMLIFFDPTGKAADTDIAEALASLSVR